MTDPKIILEGLNGPHSLSLGDYYLDETLETIFVGIGDFGGGGGGITPTGVIRINVNGSYNITNFAEAVVEVPTTNIGTINITSNGEYTVDGKRYANVNVPTTNTGTIVITSNGTFLVDGKRYANVNVPPEIIINPSIIMDITTKGPISVNVRSVNITDVISLEIEAEIYLP